MDIETIKNRLEKAEVGTRELDKQIFCMFPDLRVADADAYNFYDSRDGCVLYRRKGKEGTYFLTGSQIPHYTTSIDAALVLAASELDKCVVQLNIDYVGMECVATLNWFYDELTTDTKKFILAQAIHKSTPIAILIALLSALIEMEERK